MAYRMDELRHNMSYTMDPRFLSKLTHLEDYMMAAVLFVSGVSGGMLNTMVLLVCFKFRKLVKAMEIYIIYIALLDLLIIFILYPFCIPSSILHHWIAGDIGCDIYGILGSLLGIGSIYSLSTMSFARYLKICVPAYSGISWRWVVCSLAVAQLGAVFWAVTPMVGWGHYGAEPHGTSCTVAWGEQLNVSFTVSLFIFALFVPVAVMVCAYWAIVRHIRQEGSEATTWADIRMMKMSFLMCGGFVVAWGPYAAVSIAELCATGSVNPRVSALPALFAKSAAIYNPLIYFLSSQKFRGQAVDLLHSIWPAVFRSPAVNPTETGPHPVNNTLWQNKALNPNIFVTVSTAAKERTLDLESVPNTVHASTSVVPPQLYPDAIPEHQDNKLTMLIPRDAIIA